MPLLFPLCGPRGCRRDPYPLTEHSHGENQTRRLRLRGFPRANKVGSGMSNGRKEERKVADDSPSLKVPSQVGLARREQAYPVRISLLSPGESKLASLVASRARLGRQGGEKWWCTTGEKNGESAWRRELRSFNCLLEKLIKSILPEASRGTRGARGQFTRFGS